MSIGTQKRKIKRGKSSKTQKSPRKINKKTLKSHRLTGGGDKWKRFIGFITGRKGNADLSASNVHHSTNNRPSPIKTDIHKIGEGAFGCAYRVVLPGGQNIIRKLSVIADESKDNELNINKILLEKSTKDPTLKNHLIIMIKYELKQDRTKYNNCRAELFLRKEYSIKNAEKNPNYLLLDMPDGGEELSSFLTKHNADTKVQNEVINKALQSLKKLHGLGIYHGDFHIGNVLIDTSEPSNIKARIIDFGSSGEISEPGNLEAKTQKISNLLMIIDFKIGMYYQKTINKNELEQLANDKSIRLKLDLFKFIYTLCIVLYNKELNINIFKHIISKPIDDSSYIWENYEAVIKQADNSQEKL